MHMESYIGCCANACLKAWYSTVQETSINSHIALVPNNRDNKVKDMFDQLPLAILQLNRTTFRMQCFTKAVGSYFKYTS